ncbi:MAG TPA: CoA transferase [Candidatus Binataceae bacterium]|nr:CoA transferase [Candidatus Binataceae bacterium]
MAGVRNDLVPQKFGPLQGVRIVSTGTGIAQPFAAELAAEMGAEVIHVEAPQLGDPYRRPRRGASAIGGEPAQISADWVQERRNMFCVTLDPGKPRGRGLLLRMLGRAEIWMEGSAPGACEKIGLGDAVVLQAWPRLVITHVSAFGRDAALHDAGSGGDLIAQAFGGLMGLVGPPDPEPPVQAMPYIGDYMTALCALWSSLAALVHVRATGQGQSVDVARYEVVHKHLGPAMIDFFQRAVVTTRNGNKSPGAQPLDTFRARDEWVMIAALREQYGRLCKLLGLDPKQEKWQHAAWHVNSPEGLEFDAIFRAWVAQRSAEEVLRELGEIGVPCARIMTSAECAANPHFQAREMHIEWEDGQAGRVKGIGMVPKLSATPGQVWRGAVALGHDNRLIYGEVLGLDDSELEDLRRTGVI